MSERDIAEFYFYIYKRMLQIGIKTLMQMKKITDKGKD